MSSSLSYLLNEISWAQFISFLYSLSPFEFFLQSLWLTGRIQRQGQHFLALVRGLGLSWHLFLRERTGVFRKLLCQRLNICWRNSCASSPAQWRRQRLHPFTVSGALRGKTDRSSRLGVFSSLCQWPISRCFLYKVGVALRGQAPGQFQHHTHKALFAIRQLGT